MTYDYVLGKDHQLAKEDWFAVTPELQAFRQ
jgi:hypothetical protein